MIKIFSAEKVIYLTDKKPLNISNSEIAFTKINSSKEMNIKFHQFINDAQIQQIYFLNQDVELLFKYFSSLFRFIEAAGGLVKNKKEEYLFIFRNGKWDLPKGKREKNESIEHCALREVEEECGISGLTITKEIISTYHTYYMEEKAVLKRTYWFEMECNDTSKLKPQVEEGIMEAKWMKKKDFKQVIKNTYPSIMDVISVIA